jgi:hypothetical protein
VVVKEGRTTAREKASTPPACEEDDMSGGRSFLLEGVRAKRWASPLLVLGCSVEEGRKRKLGPGRETGPGGLALF